MMTQKGYYCYKWVKNNEIIYVGKTTEPISRIKTEKYSDKFKTFSDAEIYILRLKNPIEMDFMEKILIDHYSPLLNTTYKSEASCDLPFRFEDLEWITFEEFKYQLDITEDKDRRIVDLENELEEAKHTIQRLENSLGNMKRQTEGRTEAEKELKRQFNEYIEYNNKKTSEFMKLIDNLISGAVLFD